MLTQGDDGASACDTAAVAFAQITWPFAAGIVIAAVSGGSDSTALLLLLRDWLAAKAPYIRLVAVTVDHGLRAQSASEASAVAALCDQFGVAHETLVWSGDKPERGRMAAAREARYRLLDEAARRLGAAMVLTGHTADDQAETIAMRTARGPGRGLAGIAPATLYERRTWFVRPLLGVRRAALRDHLALRGVAWIDDPTNSNPVHERARARALSPQADGSVDILARLSDAQCAARVLRDPAVFEQITADGATLNLCGSRAGERAELNALCHVLTLVGRRAHLPGRDAIAGLAAFFAAPSRRSALTVHGCTLRSHGDLITVAREVRNDGNGRYGGDHLLPSFDHAVALALDLRIGRNDLPSLPFADPASNLMPVTQIDHFAALGLAALGKAESQTYLPLQDLTAFHPGAGGMKI